MSNPTIPTKTVPGLPPALNLYEFEYANDLTRRIDAAFDAPHYFRWIDTAWVLMLIRQGILPRDHVPAILKTVREFWDETLSKKLNGFGGVEMYAIQKLGVDIAGSLTIARTIPPLRQLMPARHDLMKLICMLQDLQETLLDTAEAHAETVMPGYTHVRQAQPETFGHYLLSAYDPMARIMGDIEEGCRRMSLNELGCGAMSGTSLPIDRELTSAYLGLEGLIENSNDAVAYTDGYVHLVAALANLAAVWSRVCMDFQYWSGEEYGFLHIPWLTAKHAAQKDGGKGKSHSHFMPNKIDNSPYTERTRVASAKMAGYLSELITMSGRAPHADTQEMLHMLPATKEAIRSTHLNLHVWIHVLPRLGVNKARMLEMARRGYSCASELSNRMVMEHGLSCRVAHEIVYEMVAAARAEGIPAAKVPLSLFHAASEQVIGRKLELTESALREALDPEHFIEVTTSTGGTAPSECRRMIGERRGLLETARHRHAVRVDKLEAARTLLLRDLREEAA